MRRIIVVFMVLSMILLGSSCRDEGVQSFKIAYLPIEDSMEIQDIYSGFENDLSDHLGIEVESFQTTSYAAAVEAITGGRVDMVMLTPFSYIVAENRGGVELLLELSIPGLADPNQPVAMFFVHKDSDIKTYEDMRGKTIAFGDPASTTGHLIPKYKLITELGLTVDELENEFFGNVLFSGGHDRTVIGVAQGAYDIGASYWLMPAILVERGVLEEGEVIAMGGAGPELGIHISGTPMVVRESLSSDLKSKVKSFLLSYENQDYFMALIGGSSGAEAHFIEPDNSSYDGMRSMSVALGLTEEELLGE